MYVMFRILVTDVSITLTLTTDWISTFCESQKKFQRNCNEEERIKKNAKKQITESFGSADVKVDDDAPTFLEQLQQEVNQLMNA